MTRRLITVAEAAAKSTLAESTLYAWASAGRGPRTFKLGGRRVYDEAEFDAWVADQEQATAKGGSAPR